MLRARFAFEPAAGKSEEKEDAEEADSLATTTKGVCLVGCCWWLWVVGCWQLVVVVRLFVCCLFAD